MAHVSVVIPCYNHARFLGRAIESVLNQTFRDVEVLVVDDGSTDDVSGAVARWGAQVRYHRQDNLGLGAARNTGARATAGEWLAFLDADDQWKPAKLERQLATGHASPEIAVVYVGAELQDEQGRVVGRFLRAGCSGGVLPALWEGNFICSGSNALIRRRSFERVGGFDEARVVMGVADWDLWLRLAAREQFAYVADPLVLYTVRPDSMSQDWDAMARGEYYLLTKHLSPSRRSIQVDGIADRQLVLPTWSVGLARRMGRPSEARRYFWAMVTAAPWRTLRAKTPLWEFLATFKWPLFARTVHCG